MMRLVTANRLDEVLQTLDRTDDALQRMRVDHALCADIRLVLEEVLVNTVTHGYPDERDGRIELDLRHESGEIVVEVRDDAEAFNPLEAGPAELCGLDERDRVGGWGIHLMCTLAREIRYARSERGNHLTLRFFDTAGPSS